MLHSRQSLALEIFNNFNKSNWPGTIMVTGEQTKEKFDFIYTQISEQLAEHSYRDEDLETLMAMIKAGEHPDFYCFKATKIAIGDEKKSPVGTVRHLLKKYIPYAPRNGSKRFILFEDASYINDEAESALLKTLEEPDSHTYIILSVTSSDVCKDTIVSRSMIVPYVSANQVLPSEPWQRYFTLSGYLNTEEYSLAIEQNWLAILKNEYDSLTYSLNDFLIFENIGLILFKEQFSKQTVDMQARMLLFSFLPLYYSIRDRLSEGLIPTTGPIRIGFDSEKQNLIIKNILEDLFKLLRTRYFGTRSPNLNAAYSYFLARLIEYWK